MAKNGYNIIGRIEKNINERADDITKKDMVTQASRRFRNISKLIDVSYNPDMLFVLMNPVNITLYRKLLNIFRNKDVHSGNQLTNAIRMAKYLDYVALDEIFNRSPVDTFTMNEYDSVKKIFRRISFESNYFFDVITENRSVYKYKENLHHVLSTLISSFQLLWNHLEEALPIDYRIDEEYYGTIDSTNKMNIFLDLQYGLNIPVLEILNNLDLALSDSMKPFFLRECDRNRLMLVWDDFIIKLPKFPINAIHGNELEQLIYTVYLNDLGSTNQFCRPCDFHWGCNITIPYYKRINLETTVPINSEVLDHINESLGDATFRFTSLDGFPQHDRIAIMNYTNIAKR